MSVEHWIPPISPIPCVEGIVGENKPHAIANVLLLVVLYLNELVSEVVVMQELVVVVSKNEMLLSLQILQQANRGLSVVAGNVPQNENMVFWLHYAIPVPHQPIVIVLRSVYLVVGERQLILRSSDWIRVCLITKVDVRYVEIVRHSISFTVFTETGQ